MNDTLSAAEPLDNRRVTRRAIDCDVHPAVPSVEVLTPYLPAYWQEQIRQSGFKGPVDSAYPLSAATSARPDVPAAHSGTVAEQLSALRTHVLGPQQVVYGILNCTYAVDSLHNPDAAAALASAINDWLAAEWLASEPRLRASLVVPSQYPELAAREIERLGDHPGFVQVLLPVRSAAPYGNRQLSPAVCRRGAPRSGRRHPLRRRAGEPANAGRLAVLLSRGVRRHGQCVPVAAAQLVVSEGVFDQFPTLRVVLIESGCTWLPSLMWRFDKEWKGLRREVPWVRRPPSDYIREHVRLTLQPFDAPLGPDHLLRFIDRLGSEEMLLFSTDYPHWHWRFAGAGAAGYAD